MGFSDQKYQSRPLAIVADSNIATGTITASGTNNVASAFPLAKFVRRTQVNAVQLTIKTAPATNLTNVNLILLSGTNTFATATVGTLTAGQTAIGTITNTAVLTTSTVTATQANGSTSVGTITTTTAYNVFPAAGQPTVTINGTGTASAQNYGAFEVFFETQELYS